MRRRLSAELALLRATGMLALLVLIWNPTTTHFRPGRSAAPTVLLDASLSLAGRGGRWPEALDSARALARGAGSVIWRFGDRVGGFDSTPPGDGASRIGPALELAAARGGPVAIVSDGEVDDTEAVPSDLLRAARIVVLPRAPFRDAFVASVDGPHEVAPTDTIRLTVAYGAVGIGERGPERRRAMLTVRAGARRLVSRDVTLPDSGILSTELTLPAARIPQPGWSALEVRVDGVVDSEPRDDARLFVVDVHVPPPVVVLAAPPDWDLHFLAKGLADVARMPITMFVQPERVEQGTGGWRNAATLAPVTLAEVRRAVATAPLVVARGDLPAGWRAAGGAVLLWRATGQSGDWYLDPPPPSPLSGALSGVPWDSLPPATAVLVRTLDDSATVVALTARLARRGPPRPVVLLSEHGGARLAEVAAAGLYRWAFRGGASTEAYRALVAGLVDWLLAARGGQPARATPTTLAVADGLPVVWRWTGVGSPRDLVAILRTGTLERRDTLRFDAAGQAELRLPPGVYRYTLAEGHEQGLVAVEMYSDEWRPGRRVLHTQPGAAAGLGDIVGARDRWWLFALVIAALTAEWAWRRRQGLP